MKTISWKLLGVFCLLSLISSCSSGGGEDLPDPPTPTPPPASQKIKMNLSCGVSSRVTDTAYEEGDKVGVYVVNYNGNTAGTLSQSGNHVDNFPFTYNSGKWNGSSTIYWKDGTTHADFYCYYPYNETVSDVTAHAFSVKEDQSTEANYKGSEFLYGKALDKAPSETTVSITTYHAMSAMVIKLEAGDGFTATSLANANAEVKINGVKTSANVNLRTGDVSAVGEAHSIIPLKGNGQYKALIVPQTVSADNLITIVIEGKEFKFSKDFTFVAGKRHTFTITVNKTSSGVNVGITDWEDDGVDNGGTAE